MTGTQEDDPVLRSKGLGDRSQEEVCMPVPGGKIAMSETTIPAQTRIGHVHLKVADIDRAVRFYHEVMGFDLLFNAGVAAFLSAGGYHHHIGLNTFESLGGRPPEPGTVGLYHFAINYPTRYDLAFALKRLLDYGCMTPTSTASS